jgi:hypothetical protein
VAITRCPVSQGSTQAFGEAGRIEAHGTLGEKRLLALEHELHRILDRHDVTLQIAVHPLEHRGKRG